MYSLLSGKGFRRGEGVVAFGMQSARATGGPASSRGKKKGIIKKCKVTHIFFLFSPSSLVAGEAASADPGNGRGGLTAARLTGQREGNRESSVIGK